MPLDTSSLIVALHYLPTEQIPDIPAFKSTIADVKCTDSLGRKFIVEMQMNWTDSFKQWLLFGTSQALVKERLLNNSYNWNKIVYTWQKTFVMPAQAGNHASK